MVKKRISVDCRSQLLTAYENDKILFEFHCVTGDAKHPTPKGKFKIIGKERIYRSKTYNAQMNFALQITTDGVFIHEAYNFSEDPKNQSVFARVISDTTAPVISKSRSWFPSLGDKEIGIGNINLIGSHGCIRIAHSNAVKLFDWAETKMQVEIK
ncbi:MAG: L,D-transpeptidase [Ferruginibacter sp.]